MIIIKQLLIDIYRMAKLEIPLEVTFLGAQENPFVNKETNEATYRGFFQTKRTEEPITVKSSKPFNDFEWGEQYQVKVLQSASQFGVFYTLID